MVAAYFSDTWVLSYPTIQLQIPETHSLHLFCTLKMEAAYLFESVIGLPVNQITGYHIQ
jgi:hypothetical protein